MPPRNTPTQTKRLTGTHCFPVARTFWYHSNSSWKRVFLIVLPSAFYSGLVTTGSLLEPIQNAFKWLKPWHLLTKVCALVNSKFLSQRLSCLRIKLPSVVITVHTVWLESLTFITKKCKGWVREKKSENESQELAGSSKSLNLSGRKIWQRRFEVSASRIRRGGFFLIARHSVSTGWRI